MNSTSAGDRGGRMAGVDDGSVLLGAPGAPGCTTTGFAGSACCARATGEKETAETLAASNVLNTIPRTEPDLGSQRKRSCLRRDVRGKSFIWTRRKSCHKIGNFQRGKDGQELSWRESRTELVPVKKESVAINSQNACANDRDGVILCAHKYAEFPVFSC